MCKPKNLGLLALNKRSGRLSLKACVPKTWAIIVLMWLDFLSAEVPVPAGLESWRFATDPLLVVLPAGHSLAKRKSLSFAQALEHPLIGVHQGGALDRSLHERAAALHRPKALMDRLVAVVLEIYDGKAQLRTLQRRVKAWRSARVMEMVLGGLREADAAAIEA